VGAGSMVPEEEEEQDSTGGQGGLKVSIVGGKVKCPHVIHFRQHQQNNLTTFFTMTEMWME